MIGYKTEYGKCIQGDSLDILNHLKDNSIQLIITSPPFSLQRHKSYGEVEQSEYVDWLLQFGKEAYSKLRDDGSLVIDLGGAYQKGKPVRSLHQFRFLIRMCDELGYHLAQDFYWYNTSSIPTGEWVTRKRMRCKSAVNTVWWFSKTEFPKSSINNLLIPYSSSMKVLLENPDNYYEVGSERPSGHVMSKGFKRNNGGAIPSNLLQISNSSSNNRFLQLMRILMLDSHPARFPTGLVEHFVKMLTNEGDLVVDIFAGSNTTGYVCEKLKRKWLSIEILQEYVAQSSIRFVDDVNIAKKQYDDIKSGKFIDI